MEIRFDEQVAIVTGGGTGIGRATVLALAASGAAMVIADIAREAAERVADEVRALGREALALEIDVADPLACERMADEAHARFGHIDLLVNNAGISRPMPSATMPADVWNSIIGINLSGVFFCSQAVGRVMLRQERGVIVSLASIAGPLGFPLRAPYCAAKAGVIALTKVLACEWAASGIRVNAIAPGYVETDLVRANVARGVIDEPSLRHRTPLGRLAQPEEIATAILLLACDATAYVTGETLFVDGGWSAYGGW